MLMLFSAVLLNFILGTIIYIIWKLLGRLAESKGYVEINYWIWKIVLLAFLCPVGIIVLFGIKKKGLYGFDFWYANKIRILLTVLGIVWFIGSVIRAFIYMKKMHQMHKMLQKGRKCQPEIIKKKQQICCELGQKNNIDIVKHKETGLLFDTYNEADMQEKLAWALQNKEEMMKMSESLYHTVSTDYNREKFWAQINLQYKKLIKENNL